jgi:hypothetical protein
VDLPKKADGTNGTLTSSTITNVKIQSVGRDVLSSACLLCASAALRTKIRSSRERGGANDFDSVGAKSSGDNNLVIASLKENMNLYEFGATRGGKK